VYFNMLRMTLEILWNCGASKFAEDFGFVAQSSAAYLESGGDIHKTIQFVMDVMWPALNNAAIRQYHMENPACDFDDSAAFVAWLANTANNDATFQSNATLLTHVLPALYCVITGQRINHMTMYLAGCKTLCRFVFVLGKYNYGPAMLNEWLVLWRCSEEVLRQRFENFSPLGEPFGLKLEASNRRVKRGRTSTTKAAWRWAIIMEEVAKTFRSNILSQLGLRERDYEERSASDVTRDIVDVATKMYDARTWTAVLNRTDVRTFMGDAILRLGCHELYALGQQRMESYVESFLKEPPSLTFPPKVYMSDALEAKAKVGRAKAAATRAANLAAKNAARLALGLDIQQADLDAVDQAQRAGIFAAFQVLPVCKYDANPILQDVVDDDVFSDIEENQKEEEAGDFWLE
jgi:hypothetical protein